MPRERRGGVQSLIEYPLSDADIRRVLGNDIPILTYPELEDLHSIDDCFDRKGRCIILFLTDSETSGHWCCMMKKKDGIYFWDPYGEAPEEQKDGIPKTRLEQLDMDEPFLTRLMRGSGRPIYYNSHQYQTDRRGINTCGRWCIARLLYAPKSEEYFRKAVKSSGLPPDEFVVGLTANWLKK
jgi:hypothetical protein